MEQKVITLCKEYHAQESSEFIGIENCIQNIIKCGRWDLLMKILSVENTYVSTLEDTHIDELCKTASLYELLKIGSIQLIEKFTQHMSESELEYNFSKNLEHLTLNGVKLMAPIKFYAQERLFSLRFQEKISDERATVPTREDIERRRKFTWDIIGEVAAYHSSGEVDDVYLLKLDFISQNMFILKHQKKQLKKQYRNLPWNEVQFLVSLFVSFYKNQDALSGFMLPFGIKRLLEYLQPFHHKCETGENIKKINEDFILAKSMYTIGKINKYLKLAKDVDLSEQSEVGKYVIERTIQVVGEFLKTTHGSPNIPKYLESTFEDSAPLFLSHVRQLRDCLSHTQYVSKRSNIKIQTYEGIKNELREMYPKIVNILYIQQYLLYQTSFEECCIISDSIDNIDNAYTDNYITLGLLKFFMHNCEDAIRKQIVAHYFKNVSEFTVLVRFFEIIKNIYDSEIIRDAMLFSSKEANQLLQKIFQLITKKPFYAKVLHDLQQMLCDVNKVSEEEVEIHEEIKDRVCILNTIFDRYEKLGIKTMTLQKFNENEDLKIAFEMLTLDVLNIYKTQLTDLTETYYPMLLGKNLRNQLAHSNLLYESFPNMTSIYLTAISLKDETIKVNSEIALKVHNVVDYKTRYEECLEIVKTQRAMFNACKLGSAEKVKKCIRNGADINGTNCLGFGALDFAAQNDNIKVFKYLESVLPIITDNEKLDRLYKTCINNNSRMVLGLLLERYKSHVQHYEYFHMATCKNSTFMIQEFIKNGVNVNVPGINNLTALHIAVLLSHSGSVKKLLEKNADPALIDDKGNTPLHVAATMGHNQFVEILASRTKGGVNSKNNLEQTPLHKASTSGHLSVVKNLIKLGADIDARDITGKTPLHFAAEFGREDVVKFLIEKSADVRSVTRSQQSAMHLSARNGHLKILQCLFDKNSEDVNSRDYEGNTALYLAIQHNREVVVEYLMVVGGSVSHCNNYGQYPLDLASSYGNDNIYKLLIRKGVNQTNWGGNIRTAKYSSTIVEMKNNPSIEKIISVVHSMSEEYVIDDQMDLLQYLDKNERKLLLLNVSFHGHSYSVIALHNAGISFTDTDIQEALQLAALKGHIGTLKVLFATYVENYALAHHERAELFYYAAINGNDNIVKFLIGKGFDINSKFIGGCTALHLTVICGTIQGIGVLLKNRAEIHAKDDDGNSVLHHAVLREDHLEIMKALIEYGADVKAEDKHYKSVLHRAVERRCNLQAIKFLIENGANYNKSLFEKCGFNWYIVKFITNRGASIAGKDGKTVLHFAAEYNDSLDVFKFVIDSGVECNAKDKDHKTALHYAVQHEDNLNKIQFLISCGADVNAKDRLGKSILHYAAQCIYNLEVIIFLKDLGADLNCIDRDGKSVVHYAAHCEDNLDVLQYLSENGVNFGVKDKKGKSALRYALECNGNINVIKLLTDNCFAKDRNHKSAIYSVLQHKCNLQKIKFLVDRGVDHNEISNHLDDTPICKINMSLIQLLNGGFVDLNAKDENGNTVLICAIREGYDLDVIKYLGNIGADCNAINNKGKSTLHYSLKKKHCLEEIYFLIGKGANCNVKDNNGMYLLHKAVQIDCGSKWNKNDGNLVLQEYSSDDDVPPIYLTRQSATNIKEETFTVEAVDNNTLDNVVPHSYILCLTQLLIENDADVNAKDTKGKSVLHYAIESKDYELALIKFLILNGADCNAKDNKGKSLLLCATKKNDIVLANVLISHEADCNAKDNNGKSLLHSAAGRRSNFAMMKFLIMNGADLNATDNNGRTLLHYAVRYSRNLEIAKFLIDNGEDCNSKDHFGRSALHYAVLVEYAKSFMHYISRPTQNLDIIQLLVDRGADCNAKDHNLKSVLHYVAADGYGTSRSHFWCERIDKFQLQIVEFLVQNGADCNAKDINNKSVLHYAAESGLCIEAVIFIRDNADDYIETDNDGKSLLHYAAGQQKNLRLIEFLVYMGADFNVKDKHGKAAWQYATEFGNKFQDHRNNKKIIILKK